jgi:hypothetical protein
MGLGISLVTTMKYPGPNLTDFMQFVHTANPTYERRVRSSLHNLVKILNDAMGNPNQVCNAIAALPADKVNKYIDALYYLLATYPGLPADACTHLHLGPLGKTNAVKYRRTPVPGNFNPVGQQNLRVFVKPQSKSLNRTVEQFILEHSANTSVILIHLSEADVAGMDTTFNNRSTLTHICSVLRVARLMNCPICALTMKANAVCLPMQKEFDNFSNSVTVREPNSHVGSIHARFRNFARNRRNMVVMGFDACICVFANVFGANERMAPRYQDDQPPYRPPLVSLANIIMSRATLATGRDIAVQTPSYGQEEYGPLFNT